MRLRACSCCCARQGQRDPPRGFALLAVLWVVAALAALAAAAAHEARLGAEGAARRVRWTRARWAAEGCLALAQARIAAAELDASELRDSLAFGNGAGCALEAWDPWATGDSIYGDGRVNFNVAPESVLVGLPGFGEEAARAVAAARAWEPIRSLDEIPPRLTATARHAFLAQYPALVSRTTTRSGALVVVARGSTASGGSAAVEALIARAGDRAAVLRRRVW